MYATEVVPAHEERDSRFQVVQLLAEPVRQAGEAAQMHPHAEIRPLDVAGGDALNPRVSAHADWYSVHNLCGRIPIGSLSIGFPVDFKQLGVVHVRPEVFLDGSDVGLETVSGNLATPRRVNPCVQVADKFEGRETVALPDAVGKNQFGLAVQCHERVGVTPLLGVVAAKTSFFGMDKTPKLIGLDKPRPEIPDSAVEDALALRAHSLQQGKNRCLVDTRYPGDGAHAHPFCEKGHDLDGLAQFNGMPSKRLAARLRERGAARIAAVPLNPEFAVGSELLSCSVLASEAGHRAFPLVFLCGKPDNQSLGSECGLRPRLDSAPSSVQPGGGAFLFLLFLHVRFGWRNRLFRFHLCEERVRQAASCSVLSTRRCGDQFDGIQGTPCFPPIFDGFLDLTSIRKTASNRVNRCERVALLSQAAPELVQFSADVASGQGYTRRVNDFQNIFGKAAPHHTRQPGILGIKVARVDALLFAKSGECIHGFPKRQNPLLGFLLTNEYFFQFRSGRLVRLSVLLVARHIISLSEELCKCQAGNCANVKNL